MTINGIFVKMNDLSTKFDVNLIMIKRENKYKDSNKKTGNLAQWVNWLLQIYRDEAPTSC